MQTTLKTEAFNQGETVLHIGKNKTIGDLVEAVLSQLSYNEAHAFKVVFEREMHNNPDFLARETQWQELLESVNQ